MPRQIDAAVRQELEARQTGVLPLFFVTFDHPDLTDPVRLVNDVVDYIYQAVRWTGFPFEPTLLSDSEGPPRATLRLQNVDRRLGEIVMGIPSAPQVTLEVLTSLDFAATVDVAQDARLEIGSPTAQITAANMELRQIRGDAITIEGELTTWDPTAEPYPAIRATKERLPALFR